jgi:hypothetical protein
MSSVHCSEEAATSAQTFPATPQHRLLLLVALARCALGWTRQRSFFALRQAMGFPVFAARRPLIFSCFLRGIRSVSLPSAALIITDRETVRHRCEYSKSNLQFPRSEPDLLLQERRYWICWRN